MQRNSSSLMVGLRSLILSYWFDRLGALLSILLGAWSLFQNPRFHILYFLFFITCTISAVCYIFRRRATDADTRPWVLLLSLARLLWPIFFFWLPWQRTVGFLPPVVSDSIAFCLFCCDIYARLSLGRNIGIVPAKRRIVTTGAYGIVRHPIQATTMLFFWNILMAHFSWLCLAAVVLGTVIFISKSRLEEKFLAHDEEYQAYLARVKWRFVPLVV